MPVFHTIEPKDVWLGDHLYIWSTPFHQHHGIVMFVDSNNPDESHVLEFNTYDGSIKMNRARIQIVTLKKFRKNKNLKRVIYGSRYARFKRAGTAYLTQCLTPEWVVDNAQLLLEHIELNGGLIVPNESLKAWDEDEGHGYNLLIRNCECLAYWCKTGRWYSEQVVHLVANVSQYLLAFMKGIFDFLVRSKYIPPIGQEAISELLEQLLPACGEKFCTLLSDGIGNALAFVIVEVIKLAFRLHQLEHNQMTQAQFIKETIGGIVKSLTVGVFAFVIQGILSYLTFGTAMACPWIGGFAGSLIGAAVGDILGRLVVNGVAQLAHPWLSEETAVTNN